MAATVGGIEVHVACDRFRIYGHWVKRVGERAARAIKGIGIAVRTSRKLHQHSTPRSCAGFGVEDHVGDSRPLVQRPNHLRLNNRCWQFRCQLPENVAQVYGVVRIEFPAMQNIGVLRDWPRQSQQVLAGSALLLLASGLAGAFWSPRLP